MDPRTPDMKSEGQMESTLQTNNVTRNEQVDSSILSGGSVTDL